MYTTLTGNILTPDDIKIIADAWPVNFISPLVSYIAGSLMLS